jgi:lambda repressor-like predicted transcriptional regulator
MKTAFDTDRLLAEVTQAMAARGTSIHALAAHLGMTPATLSVLLRPHPYAPISADLAAGLLGWLGEHDLRKYTKPVKAQPVSRGRGFNWMLFRILLHGKQAQLGYTAGQVAEEAGINRGAYTGFVNGNRPTLLADNVFPLLAWLGVEDFREMCDE